jgi:molybdopterin-guanine dinucleotide biosynthesis protein A
VNRAESSPAGVTRTGFVLAGGRSSRMGRNKALLPYHGRPLVEFVAATVSRAAGGATLVGDPNLFGNLEFPAIPDRYPGEGPLGGILTALAHSRADWNLVAACDLPGLTAPFLSELLDRAASLDADALLPAGPSGRPEPLCAVYHLRAGEHLEQAFAAGTRKITAALEGLHVIRWELPEAAIFHNVNTPDDWARYAGE